MAAFQEKYTDEQREAVRHAGLDLGIATADIQGMAKAGTLKHRGVALEPFEIPTSTVYGLIRDERKRREGKDHSALVQMPHVDAVELLRRRMVALLDSETLRMEREQKAKPRTPIDAEHARRMARALREVMAMPPPGRPGATPGAWVPGEGRPAGEAEAKANTLKGKLAKALEGGAPQGEAAPSGPILPLGETGTGEATRGAVTEAVGNADADTGREKTSEVDGGGPGSWARGQFSGISATHVDGERIGV